MAPITDDEPACIKVVYCIAGAKPLGSVAITVAAAGIALEAVIVKLRTQKPRIL